MVDSDLGAFSLLGFGLLGLLWASMRSAGAAASGASVRYALDEVAEATPEPPLARRLPHLTAVHGRELVDPYHWLRERDDPAVIAYLEAENRYTEAMLAHTEALQERLYREMVGRIKETDLSAPVKMDDFYYYTRTEEGKQYPIYCRRRGSVDAPEEVLLDGNALAEGKVFMKIGVFEVSPDHRYLAYSTDTTGGESFNIQVKDLATGQLLPERLGNTSYSLAWANDNRTFFYTTLDAAKRPFEVRRHVLGSDPTADTVAFNEPDDAFYVDVARTRSRRYLFISVGSSTTTEYRYLDADRPEAGLTLFRPRRHEVEYYLDHHGDSFYVRTNDGAKNFRLERVPVGDAAATAEEVLPHRPEVKLERADLFARHMVVIEREAGLRRVRVRGYDGAGDHSVELPETVYTVGAGENPEFDADRYRFTYSSLVTPRTVYDYHVGERRLEVVKEEEVLGGYDRTRYTTERIVATAPDGVAIPISLVHRRGFERNGENPCVLYGYGAYGASIDPSFSSMYLSLLDRGFVYAIAHIRGGGEMGEEWHDQGKLLAKRNTFTDFIAAAERLIGLGYTSPERLAIRGGSAGGLLMGAVVNLRPDLFKAVVAHVPFVDAINTMLDSTIPLTVIEYEEWGNPNEEEQFSYMLSYSPYDNVEAKAYPHMLVTAGLNDPRVQYWEPAKWVAKLRATKTDSNRLLLKIHMGAGHGGASGRYDYLKERALEYAFILDSLALAE